MSYRILLLTDQPADASTLEAALSKARDGPYTTEWLRQLSAGLERIAKGGIDAILVDMTLVDSVGIATFDRLFAAAPRIPIMTLSAMEEEPLAIEAVQRGAQGYLSKGYFSSSLVPQSLHTTIQRKALEESLFKEKARAEIALNSIGDAVICTDTRGNIEFLNPAAEQITGWEREEAQGQPIAEVFQIINGVTREPQRNSVELVVKRDELMGLPPHTLLVRRDGSEIAIKDSAAPIHDWHGEVTGAVIVFHDASAAQAMTEKMSHLAHHDFLTNLPNRVVLNDRIQQAITLAKRNGTQVAVLFLDLDNFKTINDSLGHRVGDALLQSVTQRLTECVRRSDTISRQGGDEFVILVAEDMQEDAAANIAESVLDALNTSHLIEERELLVTTSIGISVYPGDGETSEVLIMNADTAMYHAKEMGRNNYQFFSSEMNIRAVERQRIESGLRRALKKHEFVLHYQPIFQLESGAITGVEALVRWVDRERGTLFPDQFIPIAEACGLIVPLGRWVLREACTQAKRWQNGRVTPLSIAVNISALEFRDKQFVESVRAVLLDTGLPPNLLQLELTESILMRDADASSAILRELKDLGVQLAIDDFGTGYSSLSYLRHFPIDILKIDRSFVADITLPNDGGIVVSAVISMANSMKKRVVAEGVELQAQVDLLRAQNCGDVQGYLFSRPLNAHDLGILLDGGRVTSLGTT